jgi:hypothetical protein
VRRERRRSWRYTDKHTRETVRELKPESNRFERELEARANSGLSLMHRRAYDCMATIKQLGGVWLAWRKVWVMPDRESLERAREACEAVDRGAAPQPAAPAVPKRLTLYTATNDAPTAVGGIVAQGQGASVRLYRVLEVPHPYAFRGTAKDHFRCRREAEATVLTA